MRKEHRTMKSLTNPVWTMFLIIELMFAAAAFAQSFQIQGTVTASATTVVDASVTFINAKDPSQQITTRTDAHGVYRLSLLTNIASDQILPNRFQLLQNYPNPFSTATSISYQLVNSTPAVMTIYDVLGREVKRFTIGNRPDHAHTVLWDGRNESGEKIAPGTYFYQLRSQDKIQVKKMLYLPGASSADILSSGTWCTAERHAPLFRKALQQSGTALKVQIENSAKTSPIIQPMTIDNINIYCDTTLNFSVNPYQNSQTVQIHLDSSRQIIRGFGAANIVGWRPDMTPGQINTAFGAGTGQLGFTILRLRIPYSTDQFNLQLATAQSAYEKGALIIASPWTPPAWMKSSNDIVGGRLNDTSYASYAKHLATFVNFMSRRGVPIYAVSVQNEPDVKVTYESCDWTAAEMLRFVRDYAPAIGTKVMAPESFNFNHDLSDPILNDSLATANVSILAGHIYGGGLTPYPLAQAKGKEVWMTEHLDTDVSWEHVLATGKEINDCLLANMNAYIWWYLVRFYGPIDENGKVTPRGYVLSQFSRFIRPGFRRIDVTGRPSTNVFLSAYRKDGQVVIVAINTGIQAVEPIVILRDGYVAGFKSYVTSNTKNCAEGQSIAVTGSLFKAALAPSSITTYVSY